MIGDNTDGLLSATSRRRLRTCRCAINLPSPLLTARPFDRPQTRKVFGLHGGSRWSKHGPRYVVVIRCSDATYRVLTGIFGWPGRTYRAIDRSRRARFNGLQGPHPHVPRHQKAITSGLASSPHLHSCQLLRFNYVIRQPTTS
jgi:hypothetical protein